MKPRDATPTSEPSVVGVSQAALGASTADFFASVPIDEDEARVDELATARFFDLLFTNGDES